MSNVVQAQGKNKLIDQVLTSNSVITDSYYANKFLPFHNINKLGHLSKLWYINK